jgi:hypothetical protein
VDSALKQLNPVHILRKYEGESKSFRTGSLERELQMVQLSATRCSCIAILWVCLVNFVAITICVASQRVFMVVYFVIESVRKILGKSSQIKLHRMWREELKTNCVIETAVTLTDISPRILRHHTNYTRYVKPTTRWSLPQFGRFSPKNTISNTQGCAIIQVQVQVVQFLLLLCFITGITTYCSLLLFLANVPHFKLIMGYCLTWKHKYL